ncbi:Cellular repressor of E1A-stimulated proteins 1 [Branchiostoma belcheri]|nr:Cellular repressor of E1A-stimulated proteins 1 [Branchiostoma belcheri]
MNLLVLTLTTALFLAAESGSAGPPPHGNFAATARYVLHNNGWGSLASTSTHPPIQGKPYVDAYSVSDGPVGNSTGVPYFFFSPLERTVQDLQADPFATLLVSEVQSGYCASAKWDPEDPRCAKVHLSGNVVPVPEDETDFAMKSLFSRHPIMAEWYKMPDHKFYFAKMEIEDVFVLDFFGGGQSVSPEDYFKANP